MSEPLPLTGEQQSALESAARITIVRAGPGSGKTRLFVAAVHEQLQNWHSRNAGLAALSFTNVAHNEITDRLGRNLGFPHFVGTLDSFMLRFVVRPFAAVVGASAKGIRLVPSPLDMEMTSHKVKIGPDSQDLLSVFHARFNQLTNGKLTFKFHEPRSGRKGDILPTYSDAVFAGKRGLWQNSGLITHSDTHYLAATILEQHKTIAKLLVRRFPVILVDELQDTSWFLGRALVELLKTPEVMSLVVGDPDQAIYEFGGANPFIFPVIEQLEGAQPFPLATSQRCAGRICRVASALSESKKQVVPKADALAGRSVILVHNLNKPAPDIALIKSIASLCPAGNLVAVLARRNATLSRLKGIEEQGNFPGRSRLARAIDRATALLRSNQSSKAGGIVANELSLLVFGEQVFNRKKLVGSGINLREWKQSVYTILRAALQSNASHWNDWIIELRNVLEKELSLLTTQQRSVGQLLKKDSSNLLRSATVSVSPPSWPPEYAFLTVHQAKGREFENVVFFQPKPHAQHDPCPSTQWFGSGSEEKRISYVAATRAKHTLVLCIHKKTMEALQSEQSKFVELFETVF